ncbi:MAG: molybdopterin biosynthesis protein MoeY, partial [Pseudomonadota bacterium]|nr:molybdopterin biosynthesis protein MoeY [Pseudomonadota bacterium]
MKKLERILDLARWAPSGDNSQPWCFEILSDTHVLVHAFDTRAHCVYDLEGRASQLSVGAMLETMRIAASTEGCGLRTARRQEAADELPLIDAWLDESAGVPADPLGEFIRQRSVQRRPLSTATIRPHAIDALASSVGPRYDIVWFQGPKQRLHMAWLAARSAKIRLTIPEAYAVHRDIIHWGVKYSEEGVPDQALG